MYGLGHLPVQDLRKFTVRLVRQCYVLIFVTRDSPISNLMLSKAATYAIQSLAYLAVEGRERQYVPISEIAEKLDMPYHFLKKILADLVTNGLLESHRSARGGIALIKEPEKVTLLDIIQMVDGTDMFTECILKLPGCGKDTPCPLHKTWSEERGRLLEMYSGTNLKSIADSILSEGLRIGT